MAKKFVVAMMMHETNTFSPLPTPIESFARTGDLTGPKAIAASEGTNTSLGGFIEVARKAGAEFTVPMAASAHQLFLAAAAAGHGGRDDSFVIRFWENLAGISLPAKPAGE